jgi:hypothetical protein
MVSVTQEGYFPLPQGIQSMSRMGYGVKPTPAAAFAPGRP